MKTLNSIVLSVVILLTCGTAPTVKGQDLVTNVAPLSLQKEKPPSSKSLAKGWVKKAKEVLKDIEEDQKLYLKLQQLYDGKKSAPKNSYLSAVLGMGWELNHEYGIDIAKLIATHTTLPEGRHRIKLGEILDKIYMERSENVRLMSSLEKFTSPIPDIYKN